MRGRRGPAAAAAPPRRRRTCAGPPPARAAVRGRAQRRLAALAARWRRRSDRGSPSGVGGARAGGERIGAGGAPRERALAGRGNCWARHLLGAALALLSRSLSLDLSLSALSLSVEGLRDQGRASGRRRGRREGGRWTRGREGGGDCGVLGGVEELREGFQKARDTPVVLPTDPSSSLAFRATAGEEAGWGGSERNMGKEMLVLVVVGGGKKAERGKEGG